MVFACYRTTLNNQHHNIVLFWVWRQNRSGTFLFWRYIFLASADAVSGFYKNAMKGKLYFQMDLDNEQILHFKKGKLKLMFQVEEKDPLTTYCNNFTTAKTGNVVIEKMQLPLS
jgi:hypothetical protein